MTKRILEVGGSRGDVDEAMSDLAQHVYNSLPNYVKRGNVPLVQWVTGVATNRLQEFARTTAQSRTQSTSLIDEFAHEVVMK